MRHLRSIDSRATSGGLDAVRRDVGSWIQVTTGPFVKGGSQDSQKPSRFRAFVKGREDPGAAWSSKGWQDHLTLKRGALGG